MRPTLGPRIARDTDPDEAHNSPAHSEQEHRPKRPRDRASEPARKSNVSKPRHEAGYQRRRDPRPAPPEHTARSLSRDGPRDERDEHATDGQPVRDRHGA